MLVVAFFAFVLPFAVHAQGSGQKPPPCPEDAKQVGGANTSSSNAAAGSNAQCKKGGQEGFFQGQPYQWKCSKGEQTMTNKLDAPCDYSGEGGKVQGKCSADGECKASKPEGKPPEMPQMPSPPGGGGEKPQQPPQKPEDQSATSTASTTRESLMGTSTPGLNSWQWGSTTDSNASTTQGTTTAFGFQMQSDSNQENNGTNWTGVNGWDGWIRKATSMVGIDESNIGTAGSPGSPDQARPYGSHAQFQQNVGFSQWSSIFNDYIDHLRASGNQGYSSSSPRSPGSASGGGSSDSGGQGQGVATGGSQGAGQVAPSGGAANDDPRSDFYQYTASVSFKENNPNAYPTPSPSIFNRAYNSFMSTVRNVLGI
jgi:hypothetical protein